MKGWAIVVGLAWVAVACGGNVVRLGTSGDGGSANDGSGSGGDGGSGSSGGGGGGATSLASEIQETPTNLVSDGTSLFWVSSVGSGAALSGMPVGGGPIATVVPAPIPGGFLAVDDVNVYFLGQSGGLYSAPKGGGGSSTPISDAGATITGVTTLGGMAYWVELVGSGPNRGMAVKSAALAGGGTVSILAEFTPGMPLPGSNIGVTTSTVFLSSIGMLLSSFPLSSGVSDGGVPPTVPGPKQLCESFASDTDAVYCDSGSSISRIASDGTPTVLGTVVDESGTFGAGNGDTVLAFDDTSVYWVDNATVGTIMSAPKTGGTASIIARDTSPVAIAVDANAVYWSDQGGNIMRLAK